MAPLNRMRVVYGTLYGRKYASSLFRAYYILAHCRRLAKAGRIALENINTEGS